MPNGAPRTSGNINKRLRPAPSPKRSPARRHARASSELLPMNQEKRREIFARLAELNPKPTTELHYSSPFELLVAVMLSAQSTDVGVNKATRKLFPVANTPAAMFALGETRLKKFISSIGLFNGKAANI